MESFPKVSILIPCYNSSHFLDETLNSCISQDYPNIEIIIVDDGSSDNSLQKLRHWEATHSNIHVYQQPNLGACHARNYAFEKSTGFYIMYLDADDILSPNKISDQVKLLECSSPLTISSCPWTHFKKHVGDTDAISYYCYKDYSKGIDLLLDLWSHGEMFQTSCYLVPRQLIIDAGPWIDGLKKNQDGEFFSRVLMRANNVHFCDTATVFYRIGEYDSVSKDNSKSKVEALLYTFDQYKKNILNIEDSKRVRKALSYNYMLFRYLFNGKYPDLSQKAKEQLLSLDVSHPPLIGPARVKKISRIIGFENFLRLRKLFFKR